VDHRARAPQRPGIPTDRMADGGDELDGDRFREQRLLKVAGPGSVRIEEDNPWVVRSGYWEDPSVVAPVVSDFWSLGRAIRSAYSPGETRRLTIETHCQSTHDIYVGTRLDTNCGIVSASLDGGTPVTLDCYCPVASTGQLRRPLFTGVPAGSTA